MSSRRVVVTGMGALTPIGNNLDSYWNGLISGTSGCASITHFDASNFKTKFACELKGFDPANHFERKSIEGMISFLSMVLLLLQRLLMIPKLLNLVLTMIE